MGEVERRRFKPRRLRWGMHECVALHTQILTLT